MATEKHYIALEGIEIFARHGYYAEEQKTGGKFIVNLVIETDFSRTEQEDSLALTINYESMARLVKEEMERNNYKLIEHLAHHIKNRVLALSGNISWIRLEIKKQHPPLVLKAASANVIIEYHKKQKG